MQQVQGRQGQSYAGTGYKGNATSSRGNNIGGQTRVVKFYNCQGEGHIARQCTQPKRHRNAAWFKEKATLAEAQESGQILDEEQLAFLTKDLDAYDSDCDDVSNAKAVLMANLSNYGSDVILEVPHFKPYHTDMDNQNSCKRFVPQQELSNEQDFWLQTSHPNTDQSALSPVKIEASRELSKHLKKIYKDQFDSIKKTCALSKEHYDSLIAQLNSKSIKITDLKGKIQEKVFVITTLQNELRKLKGKNMLDNATTITISPGMFKLDLDPLAPRLLKNRDAHIDYLKYTQDQADILQGVVEQPKAKQLLDNALEFSCKHA
nr:hypothetical protein [Tanacetum cinerariifolium]